MLATQVRLSALIWQWMRPLLLLTVVVLVIGACAAVLARRVQAHRRPGQPRLPFVRLSALGAALGAGVFTMAITFHGTTLPVQGSRLAVQANDTALIGKGGLVATRDMIRAGRYVDQHAGVDDVVATTMYCRFSRAARDAHVVGCDARNFVASALTARRTLVGGWAYSDRDVVDAWSQTTSYKNEKFWDPTLFDEQFDAFHHPTHALLDNLYQHHHVRWLFADLQDGRLDVPALDALARPAVVARSCEVWRLRDPQRRRDGRQHGASGGLRSAGTSEPARILAPWQPQPGTA